MRMKVDLVVSNVELRYEPKEFDVYSQALSFGPEYSVTFIASVGENKFPLTFDVTATGGFNAAVVEAAKLLSTSAQNLAALAEAAADATDPAIRETRAPKL